MISRHNIRCYVKSIVSKMMRCGTLAFSSADAACQYGRFRRRLSRYAHHGRKRDFKIPAGMIFICSKTSPQNLPSPVSTFHDARRARLMPRQRRFDGHRHTSRRCRAAAATTLRQSLPAVAAAYQQYYIAPRFADGGQRRSIGKADAFNMMRACRHADAQRI